MNDCINSNTIGTNEVFNFCLKNKIKLIYSATSASIGNKGNDKNLSPYSFTKAKNLEMLENLKNWYNFKFEIIYFYNVYGPNQICSGNMATVIGIFERQYKEKKPLTVVRPGSQSRRFTHINDTVEACYFAWKKINLDIIVSQIEKVIPYLKLQRCLKLKSSFYRREEERDTHQH